VVFLLTFLIIVLFQHNTILQKVEAQVGDPISNPIKRLVGYAWSENIGWIQFGNLTNFPDSNYGGNAKLNGKTLTGWARVVAGVGGKDLGGWDGWIALNNSTIASNVTDGAFSVTGCENGCAWGSNVVGWVDFSGVALDVQSNSCVGTYGTIIADGSSFTFYGVADSEGNCPTQTKNCVNGTLYPNGADFTELSCVQKNASCTRAGKTYKNREKATFYSKAIAGRSQSCELLKLELECIDGEFKDSEGRVNYTHTNLRCIDNPVFQEI
jgi:hypothetical protein